MATSNIASPLLPLHRLNEHLPPNYRHKLQQEQQLNLLALRTLAKKIGKEDSSETIQDKLHEGYERDLERDLVVLEKGVARYLSLKYILEPSDYDLLVKTFLRGLFTHGIDIGVRSKICRGIARLLDKRDCKLSFGLPWRAFRDLLIRTHVDCADGAEYVGREHCDPHVKHLMSLLITSKFFLNVEDNAQVIWNELVQQIDLDIPEQAFIPAGLLAIVLPTHGSAWTEWVPKAVELWGALENSTDWDSIWIGLLSRIAADQPGAIDWTPFLSKIYERMICFFRLPLGGAASQSYSERRCPVQCFFLLNNRVIEYAVKFIANSLSPQAPETLSYLKRLIELLANYFHPSNGGRWTSLLGAFIGGFLARLNSRVTLERSATKAGIMEKVIGSRTERAVAEFKHRLAGEYVDELARTLLPIIKHGLHAKEYYMTFQAACACRDLAVLAPGIVISPLLKLAAEGLESVSSPHRTSAALKMLATLAPVFLDPSVYPEGLGTLPQALQLMLPGIDPNDPGKTEATFRFIANASARLQTLGSEYDLGFFLEDYIYQLLERIFSLLESLEAPPKKSAGTGYTESAPLFSIFVFTIAMENLFGAVSSKVAISVAERIARQVSGSAVTNAMKFYGVLVRTASAAAASATNSSSAHIFMPLLISQVLEEAGDSDVEGSGINGNVLSSLSEEELVWRIRMLAQASRSCCGFDDFTEQLCEIAELAMRRKSRKLYKAGARLLRGMLEGLNATTVIFGADKDTSNDDIVDISKYSFNWREPESQQWSAAEKIVKHFLEAVSVLIYGKDDRSDAANGKRQVVVDRETLFQALRMLHGIQRGGRWLFAGVLADEFANLKSEVQDGGPVTCSRLSKSQAKAVLRMPVLAGLGGEQGDVAKATAVLLWGRSYEMVSNILQAVLHERPDDGALLYRALEPIELANEPFRRTTRSRYSSHTAKVYKTAYTPVINSKRVFGAEGGVGRFMPRFIVKLRIEALHELRLSYAARPGAGSGKMFSTILVQLAEMSANDFPRVRVEARGAFTRAMRVAPPVLRRKEIKHLIETLATATEAARAKQMKETKVIRTSAEEEPTPKMNNNSDEAEHHHETFYERMIGAADALRSNGIAPVMMRDWELLTSVVQTVLMAMLHAELPAAISCVTALFVKLAGLARPLGINVLVPPSMSKMEAFLATKGPSLNDMLDVDEAFTADVDRLDAYQKLNDCLLALLSDAREGGGLKRPPASKDAHWRLQSLVASALYLCIRADRSPPANVARFFAEGMASDLVTVRQGSCKAVTLMLALHGRRVQRNKESRGDRAVSMIKDVLTQDGFTRRLIHMLALDHEDHGSGRYPGGGSLLLLNLSKQIDGTACWMLFSGKPWPMSWVSRPPDTLALSRVRLYKYLFDTFGLTGFELFKPCVEEVFSKLKRKEEHVLEGVRDDDVRAVLVEVIGGMGRGLELDALGQNKGVVLDFLTKWMFSLIDSLTGPQGMINGSSFLRLLATAQHGRVGREMVLLARARLAQERPFVVPMDSGAVAHLQARRVRYIHSCVADSGPKEVSTETTEVVMAAIKDLTCPVAFSHEAKAVREEVAKCLSLLASFTAPTIKKAYAEAIKPMAEKLTAPADRDDEQYSRDSTDLGNGRIDSDVGIMEVDATGDERENHDCQKKLRSREGETLSRLVSLVYWSGNGHSFTSLVKRLLLALFRSVDDSDKERVAYAGIALSLVAQAKFDHVVVDDIVDCCDESARSSRWKIREAVLPFVEILAFSRLFVARPETLARLRSIVLLLLSDPQLEVRETAGATFVPLIRDAPPKAIAQARDRFLSTLKETNTVSRRRFMQAQNAKTKCKLTSQEFLVRHGAVLGLSSMVTSSPYSVPSWMPEVLVALTGCIEDTPPIAKSAKKIFADFWRTHRDEWQTFKHEFSEEQLDMVSELLISPSYYA